MARRHPHDRDPGGDGDRGRHRATEDEPGRLEPHDRHERHQHGRLVQDDIGRIGARDLRDEREEPVPERERVSRVEARVGELVDPPEREVAELEQLAGPGEVEEPVTADLPGDRPEEQAEHGASGRDRADAVDRRRPGATERARRGAPPLRRRAGAA